MRKLTIMEHVSLDDVVQHSDDGDGFPRADWTVPYRSPAGMAAVLAAQGGHGRRRSRCSRRSAR